MNALGLKPSNVGAKVDGVCFYELDKKPFFACKTHITLLTSKYRHWINVVK